MIKIMLLIVVAFLSLVMAQNYCDGQSFYYLHSHNISASTVAKKPLIIKGNDGIDVHVKFVVVDAPIDSNILVTILGQGRSKETAGSIGSSVDTNNGLTITLNTVSNGVTSAASSSPFSILLLPLTLITLFFGKRSIAILIVILSLSFYVAEANNPCESGQAGANVIIALPNNFAFSSHTFNINNGNLECDTDVGLFAPVCNSILYNNIPADTMGPYDAATKGYTVEWITGGIYAVFDSYGTYNTMFVVSNDGVIVVDSPPTIGAHMKNAILSVTSQPVKYFIYSHFHSDHVGSANIWADQSGIQIIGHQNVYDAIALSNSPLGAGRLLPTITFNNNYTLTLGNETLELNYLGVFHSTGDTLIYSRSHEVLLVIDLFSKSFSPFRNLFETIYVQGFMKAHEVVLNYTFDTLVGGHLNLVSRGDVERSKTLVEAIRQSTIIALNSVGYPDPGVDKNGVTNPWLQFNVYLDRATTVCVDNFRTNYPEFFSQYSALDVFIFSHCDNMVRSMRLE